MSLPAQGYIDKKRPALKKSRSQGWSWPRLVAVQPKKSASASLYTPDEQSEASPTTAGGDPDHQNSPQSPHHSPQSPTSSNTESAAPFGGAVVSDHRNVQQAESEIEQNAEGETALAGNDSQHVKAAGQSQVDEGAHLQHAKEDNPQQTKDSSQQHVDEGVQFKHTEEEYAQHTEDEHKIASEPEKVDEKASRCGDECLDRWASEPCNESNCNHGEESSQSRSDASADAEEHAAQRGAAQHMPERSESISALVAEEPSVAHSAAVKTPHISDEFSGHRNESPQDSRKTKAVIPPETIQAGDELSRIDSPVRVRDFGTPPLKDDTASLKTISTLPPPRIFIQRASDDRNTPFPTAMGPDSEMQLHETSEDSDRSSGEPNGADPLASRIAIPPEITSNLYHDTEDPKEPKVKRRKLVVRKARNLVMRKHFLQFCLGRQLAAHTKPALRRLAHGEPMEEELAAAGDSDSISRISEGSTLTLLRHER